ncbi:DUF624 domain-containing protein [Occultella glacieicola]|uniref:DUF624 domain-containing protein n=1 Tax=Occultella glacieicola TaxID=2518684 RepID=A0ABY2DY02_9MICO|nr:DUF624 domain-containing protein [Occultella glacieicola]TDE89187.1 DUF624 domain-containing protein [Occultella glacieicola]
MLRLLGWHTRAGEVGLRLLLLNLLWLLYTLRGGIVLGLFPATAAVHAVLRRDAMGHDGGTRPGLRAEFAAAWRSELRSANVIGYLLAVAWAVLLTEHRVLTDGGAQGLAAGVAAVLWFAAAFLFVVSAVVWMLAVHFDEGPLVTLRRAVLLALARPLTALGAAAILAVTLCVYYVVPGLIPVFGVAVPAMLTCAQLWRSGVLPGPARPARPARVPAPLSH